MSTRRGLLAVALAAVGGIALGGTVGPTSASWEDRGGATMSVTAVQEAPPSVVSPVQPGPSTTLTALIWTGLNLAPDPTPTQACFSVTVNTTTVLPSAWTVRVYTGQPPFDNRPPFTGFQGQIYGEIATYMFTPAADYATSGVLLVTPSSSLQYATNVAPHLLRVCVVNTPEPAWQPPGPTTYTQLSPLVFIRNGSQPCIAGTVEGHQPFHVGFSIAFDWRAVLDQLRATNTISQAERDLWIGFRHWAGGPPGYYPAEGATGTDYETTLRGYQAESRSVSERADVTIASCAF